MSHLDKRSSLQMGTIDWDDLADLVSDGYLEWDVLQSQGVENKVLGTGVIESVDGCYFNVAYTDGSIRCHSFESPLDDFFYPLLLSTNLAELISEPLKLKREAEEKRRRRQEARRKLDLKWKASIEPFGKLSQQALKNRIDAELPHPDIDAVDIQLVLEWSNSSELRECIEPSKGQTIIAEQHGKNPKLGRLLSARAAEKAAIEFFRMHGYIVEDVSIKQVVDPHNSEWPTYDLMVDNHPVDVKNSRRSESNRNSYVEHCVPKFKQSRLREDIAIAGVLSNYLWPRHILMPKDARCETTIIVLGTTTWGKIAALKSECERPGLLQIDLSPSSSTSQFLPPWLFEFGSNFYKKRDKALRQAQQLPIPNSNHWRIWQKRKRNSKFPDKNILPILIATGKRLEDQWDRDLLQEWEWRFISSLNSWIEKVGLSLPFLFCSILLHFLEMVASGKDALEYNPSKYRKFLYFDDSCPDRPLFIFDPLKTIDSLINTLMILWGAEQKEIRAFRVFRLRGLSILQGKNALSSSDHWKTLVAYCGGRKEGKGKCGYNPLVLGEARHCSRCGKLICPVCGFCSQKCYPRSPSSFSPSPETDDMHS